MILIIVVMLLFVPFLSTETFDGSAAFSRTRELILSQDPDACDLWLLSQRALNNYGQTWSPF